MSTEIFLCPPGQLSQRARSELRKAGVVVVEVDAPERSQFVRSSSLFSGDDMLWVALKALTSGGSYSGATTQRERFVELLAALADQQRGSSK